MVFNPIFRVCPTPYFHSHIAIPRPYFIIIIYRRLNEVVLGTNYSSGSRFLFIFFMRRDDGTRLSPRQTTRLKRWQIRLRYETCRYNDDVVVVTVAVVEWARCNYYYYHTIFFFKLLYFCIFFVRENVKTADEFSPREQTFRRLAVTIIIIIRQINRWRVSSGPCFILDFSYPIILLFTNMCIYISIRRRNLLLFQVSLYGRCRSVIRFVSIATAESQRQKITGL